MNSMAVTKQASVLIASRCLLAHSEEMTCRAVTTGRRAGSD
jgi:hypothetical protein